MSDAEKAKGMAQTKTQLVSPDQFKPQEPPRPGIFTIVRNRVLAGLFIVIPAIITLWIAVLVYSKLTDWAVKLIGMLPWLVDYSHNAFFLQAIRVVSLLFMLAGLFVVGQLAKMAIGMKLISLAQSIILKVPLISSIYSTTQQIGDALWSPKGGMFRKVVLFEFPKEGVWSIGFLTNEYEDGFEVKDKLGGKELISVFMPTTPNPTSGFLMFIPREKCVYLDMEVAEAMRLIISGGAVVPPDVNAPKQEQANASK